MQIEKPRMFQSTKDIVMSMGVLLVAMFLTVGFTGLCSFNPGSADKSGNVQEVDTSTFLQLEARSEDYPVVEPEMPEGWIANSARRTQVGDVTGTLVGWVIDGENYISLTQTSAPLKDASQPDDDERTETGTQKIGGDEWHVFTGEDGVRPVWVADRGGHRLILEGMASESQMNTAAEHVSKATVIDTKKSMTSGEASTS